VVRAIVGDTTAASITPAAARTANNGVVTAFQAFNKSIQAAEKAAASAGKPLDLSAVSTAVSTLQSSVNSAVAGLGSAFTASTDSTTLAGLSTSLTSIAAPTAGNRLSSLRFAVTVASTVLKAEFSVEQSIASALSGYNHNLF